MNKSRMSCFYQRDAKLARSLLSKDVWLDVHPSHAGIVSERLNLSQNFFDHLIATSF